MLDAAPNRRLLILKKMAEINVSLFTGGKVTEYIPCKSMKKVGEKLNKMIHKGELDFGAVLVDMEAVGDISVKLHEVH